MIVLGLGGAVGHDPAAAIVVDGKVVSAPRIDKPIKTGELEISGRGLARQEVGMMVAALQKAKPK